MIRMNDNVIKTYLRFDGRSICCCNCNMFAWYNEFYIFTSNKVQIIKEYQRGDLNMKDEYRVSNVIIYFSDLRNAFWLYLKSFLHICL